MQRGPRHDWSRRRLLAASAALGATSGGVTSGAVPGTGPDGPRRLVVVRDADGTNRVLADGPSPNSFELNGTRIVRLWEAPAVPVSLPVTADTAPGSGSAYRDGFRGASFYTAEIPAGVGRARIPMHRNATLDYMAVLSGEIVLLLPGREIPLAQGDTLVLAGCDHSWENRSADACSLLFVVLPSA
jgi:hypothetical protein